MFQEFNKDTIESRFVKNLVYNTPLPVFKTIREGDWLTEGCSYIHKRNLIRCTESGFYKSGNPVASYRVNGDYIFGKYYPKFTERYISHNIYYDHSTHEMLGKYLRCYRDICGIDLMPFYNCFSGYYTSSFHIANNKIVNGVDNGYKVMLFPINFNTEYTVCIDCGDTISIMPVMLNNEIPVTILDEGQYINLSEVEDFSKQSNSYNNTSFKRPFKVSINTYKNSYEDIEYAKYFQQNEKHLYLAVQISAKNQSSVVVLEGDYTDLEINRVVEQDELYKDSDAHINRIFISPLSLMLLDDRNNYAFSDRLIEYLVLSVVDKEEQIDNNITLFQEGLDMSSQIDIHPGVWNDKMRYTAFDYYKKNYSKDMRLRFIDTNGFLDKDMERLILKGQ